MCYLISYYFLNFSSVLNTFKLILSQETCYGFYLVSFIEFKLLVVNFREPLWLNQVISSHQWMIRTIKKSTLHKVVLWLIYRLGPKNISAAMVNCNCRKSVELRKLKSTRVLRDLALTVEPWAFTKIWVNVISESELRCFFGWVSIGVVWILCLT